MGEITKEFSLDDSTSEKKHRIFCKECQKETLHKVISSFEERGSQDCGGGNFFDWNCDNQIIQCLGCETVSFRTIASNSDDVEYEDDGKFYYKTIKYYPGRTEGIKSISSYFIPWSVQQIYNETILALENEQYILAGIGVRAIIETICKDLNAKGSSLYKKIDSLRKKGIVTDDGSSTLHKLRILGNDAAHEVKAHDSKQLEVAVQIVEHMLDGTYIIPERVKQVFKDDK